MTGPGVPLVQTLFQSGGWLVPSLLFAVFALIAGLCALFIVEAMQCIPGNAHFQGTGKSLLILIIYS